MERGSSKTQHTFNNCQSSGDAFIRVQKAAYALGLGTQQVLLYVHTESGYMYCPYSVHHYTYSVCYMINGQYCNPKA